MIFRLNRCVYNSNFFYSFPPPKFFLYSPFIHFPSVVPYTPLSLSTFLFPYQPSSFPINLPLSISTFLVPSQPSPFPLNLHSQLSPSLLFLFLTYIPPYISLPYLSSSLLSYLSTFLFFRCYPSPFPSLFSSTFPIIIIFHPFFFPLSFFPFSIPFSFTFYFPFPFLPLLLGL